MLVNNVDLLEADDIVCRMANKRKGKFEPETFAFIENLEPEGTFVDVGAYTGIYGIRAAQLGWRSVFFEPNPVNYERLLQNLKRNNQDHLHSYNVALSDSSGTATLHINPGTKLTTGGSLDKTTNNRKKDISVKKDRYSSYIIGDESVVKIDVEHHELPVLRGMESMLVALKPTIIVEVLDGPAEISAYLAPLGYKLEGLFDERNAIFSPT